jgi:hypothetical protein
MLMKMLSSRVGFLLEKNTNKILTILLIAVFIASIGISAYLSNQQQNIQQHAQQIATGPCRDLKPSTTIPTSLGGQDNLYVWKADCKSPSNASDSCYHNRGDGSTDNTQCPTSTDSYLNGTTSNWCYGFQGTFGDSRDFRCLQLQYTGPRNTPIPTPTTAVCSIAFQTPSLSDACVTCITTNSNIINDMKNLNPQQFNSCSNLQLVNYWCNGGVSSQGVADCNTIKNGVCTTVCNSTDPTQIPTVTLPPGTTVAPTLTQGAPTTIPTITSVAPTAIPTLSNNSQLAFSVRLAGVGLISGGNKQPKTPTRKLTVEIFNANNVKVTSQQTDITYDSASGLFKGALTLASSVTNGVYTLKASTDRYLKRAIPGLLSLTSVAVYNVPEFVLIPGDVNGDNTVDITDWNIIARNCFGIKKDSADCSLNSKVNADLNDDGTINGLDHDLLLEALRIQHGD